jgi:hypothetical protein
MVPLLTAAAAVAMSAAPPPPRPFVLPTLAWPTAIPSDWLSVKDPLHFGGAKGDGKTDDTKAIQVSELCALGVCMWPVCGVHACARGDGGVWHTRLGESGFAMGSECCRCGLCPTRPIASHLHVEVESLHGVLQHHIYHH